jgi:NAD(P)-dependent dehydrogenase (short-subunit alcohol dehydrogenase family)
VRFRGKTVLIFGGNSGIGLATARAFQAEGADVAITGRNQATLDAVAAETGMLALRSDIASIADSKASIDRVVREYGPIDILFVNAGVGGFAAADQISEAFWDEVHGINLRGCVFAIQQALPHVRDGGSIVITGSIGSVLALPGNLAYAAAKAGLRAAARILATELLPRRIRVNMVSPGATDTEIFKRNATDEEVTALRELMQGNVPMKRLAMPEEIAPAVLFLASDGASYITGIDLFVDGGAVEL